MSKARRDYLIDVADDGLPARPVGRWAEEKYRRLGMYAEMFSTGMKNQWPTRVYMDLFAGSGHCFCFVDPVNLEIDFETVKALGAERAMDFLILFAFGMDATRNWATYVRPGNTRVEKFLGAADWRERWKDAERRRLSETQFLATEYASSMAQLGYMTNAIEEMIPIRSTDKNLPLYYLAFFSKHPQGYKFWREVQKYSTDQLGLALE